MHEQIAEALNTEVPGCQASVRQAEVGDAAIFVEAKDIVRVAQTLKDDPARQFHILQVITGCDYEDRIEVSYVLASFTKNLELIVKVKLARPSSEAVVEIDSVCGVWKSANFLERECYDMLGVRFVNHPDLRRILCPYEEWVGYPLRKDYKVQENYLNMKVNPPEKMNSEDHYFYKTVEQEYGEDAKKVLHSWKD